MPSPFLILVVLLPYEITRRSNFFVIHLIFPWVLLPYEITRRSNLPTPWINTAFGFTTLWNYTTLKPHNVCLLKRISFTTLWNYTTLKQVEKNEPRGYGFTTLWNYTTLKQVFDKEYNKIVLLPYEITRRSNNGDTIIPIFKVLLPYEITRRSNGYETQVADLQVLLPYEITRRSNPTMCACSNG